MTSVLSVRWLVAAALLVLVSSAVEAADAPPRPAGMVQTVKEFLQDPALPAGLVAALDAAQFTGTGWHVPVHLKDREQEKLDGVLLLTADGDRVVIYTAPLPLRIPTQVRSMDEAEQVAVAFADRHLIVPKHLDPTQSVSRPDVQIGLREQPINDDGTYHFSISWSLDGLRLPATAGVKVRVWDLRVSEAVLDTKPLTVSLVPTVTKAEAVALATKAAVAEGHQVVGGEVYNAVIRSPGKDGRQRYLYFVVVRFGGDKAGGWDVDVDAHSGEVVRTMYLPPYPGEDAGEAATPPSPPAPDYSGSDGWPCWLVDGDGRTWVVFHGIRNRHGQPTHYGSYSTIFAIRPDGSDLRCLAQSPGESLLRPAVGGQYVAAALWGDGRTVLLDWQRGGQVLATTEQRPGWQPALDPPGQRMALAASRGTGDADIFVGEIHTAEGQVSQKGLVSQRRVAKLRGEDTLPVFAPDGDWVYFARGLPVSEQRSEVWRVRPDHWHDVEDTAERVSPPLPPILRMSAFPDGRTWLVAHAGGLDLLDIETHAVRPLGFTTVPNPDGPGQMAVEEPVVSPDGQQIAFVAQVVPTKAGDPCGRFIYVCDLDGGNLRRLTPSDDPVVPPWILPETGQPVFDAPQIDTLDLEPGKVKMGQTRRDASFCWGWLCALTGVVALAGGKRC